MGRGRGRRSIYKGTRRCNGYDLGFGEFVTLVSGESNMVGFFFVFFFFLSWRPSFLFSFQRGCVTRFQDSVRYDLL